MRVRSGLGLTLMALACASCILPRWPVEGPLASPFGVRFRGILPEIHRGVDIQVPSGTEVRAMARGTVRFVGSMRGYGQVIWVDHPGSLMSVYGHLSALRVVAGEAVSGHQVIGLSGQSGNAAGPHLHFEVWRHGREIDPVPFLGGFPPTDPRQTTLPSPAPSSPRPALAAHRPNPLP